MKNLLIVLATLLALALLALAGLALTGLATIRQPDPVVAAVATTSLLILPVLGIGSLFPRRLLGVLVGALLWPSAVLCTLPLFFPEERDDGLMTGLTLISIPLGLPMEPAVLDSWVSRLDGLLPRPGSTKPSPTAPPVVAKGAPLSPPSADSLPVQALAPLPRGAGDQVALPYEGKGHSLEIPVILEGPTGDENEVSMLFDTGATYTTLSRQALRQAGFSIPANAPVITSHTANGDVSTPVVLVDRLWVGGLEVTGVTVAVCDQCGETGSYQGLLGLNVSARFLVTLDTARQEMILEPRTDHLALNLDVNPWLEIRGRGQHWTDGRTEIEVEGLNLARRTIRSADVDIRCSGGDFRVQLTEIPAGATVSSKVSIPRQADCASFQVALATALW